MNAKVSAQSRAELHFYDHQPRWGWVTFQHFDLFYALSKNREVEGTHRLIEVLEPGLIGGQEDQRVSGGSSWRYVR